MAGVDLSCLSQKEKQFLIKLVSCFTYELALLSNEAEFNQLKKRGIIVKWGETRFSLHSECYAFVKKHNPDIELNYEAYGYSLEKEGKLEQAKEVYLKKINNGFTGWHPYERLRIIYVKQKDWKNAILICRQYISVSKNLMAKKKFEYWIKKYTAKLNKETDVLTSNKVIKQIFSNSTKGSILSNNICPNFTYPEYYKNILRNITFINSEDVPEFINYFPIIDDLSSSQKDFFEKWLVNWENGKALNLKGNHGYLLLFIRKLFLEKLESDPLTIIKQLHLLRDVYFNEVFDRFSSLIFYITFWIFECYLFTDLKSIAVSWLKNNLLLIDNTNSPFKFQIIEKYLSLKYHLNFKMEGIDLYCLSRSYRKHREILKENKTKLIYILNKKIDDFEKQYNINLLDMMTKKFAHLLSPNIECLVEFTYQAKVNIPFYSYEELGELKIIFDDWFKDAENILRDKLHLPKIGEGWVRETKLYNILLEYYGKKGYEVIHHAYPPFLNGLELDIFIPELKLAIEHQGIQHTKPINFFGGEKAFKKLIIRDKEKRRLCKENGVTLIEFFYDEPLRKEYILKKIQLQLTYK